MERTPRAPGDAAAHLSSLLAFVTLFSGEPPGSRSRGPPRMSSFTMISEDIGWV